MDKETKANIEILVTICYTKVPSQKEKFKEFLGNGGIKFRKDTNDKNHTISSYLSNIERFSKTVAKQSNAKDFDLFCFCGRESDIDKIFEYGKRFFQEEHFIRDCHSAIKQYKKFHSQMLSNMDKKDRQ